ncbi:hypothetical protein J7K55_05280 [Candidatus Aerophobetes bacterium]|nr:hypothetical protein [Candidatus Aerophobetes bacterium]
MKLDKAQTSIPEISTLGKVKNIIKKKFKKGTEKKFLRELNRRSGKNIISELTKKEKQKKKNKDKYEYNHKKVKKVEAYTPPGKKVKIEKNGEKGHIIDIKI